ncbi:unnamed protein product [Gemmataceae bacterium]|nr:unnamed protein product [Gemmataceae bacterium]VTU01338.1 unnamed protein product [Gemmataceae bacterium]
MSPLPDGSQPSSTVNTRPNSHEPPNDEIERAMRALPRAFGTAPSAALPGQHRPEKVVAYHTLCGEIEAAGHRTDAAEWAIHLHEVAGRLVAAPSPTATPTVFQGGQVFGGHLSFDNNRLLCHLRAAPALWEWRDEVENGPLGSPFARLVREVAEEERRDRERRALVEMYRHQEHVFRTAWDDAWHRFLSEVRRGEACELDSAAVALSEIGALLGRLGEMRTDVQSRSAGERLGALLADDRWVWPEGPRSAAAILLEAVHGSTAPVLREVLRTANQTPALRTGFGWLAFCRDRLFPRRLGREIAPGVHEFTEADPEVRCHVSDLRRAERYLGIWLNNTFDPHDSPYGPPISEQNQESEDAKSVEEEPVPPTGSRHAVDEAADDEGAEPKPKYKPDGPFGADGFRFAGVEVRFGRAALQRRLVLALWDVVMNQPHPPRAAEDVMAEVWGDGHDTDDATFRQLCSDTRSRFQRANCPLDIKSVLGRVALVPV